MNATNVNSAQQFMDGLRNMWEGYLKVADGVSRLQTGMTIDEHADYIEETGLTLEKIIGKERTEKVKGYRFSDTARQVLGEERYQDIRKHIKEALVQKETLYNILKEAEQETYYGFVVDAVAQNVVSIPFLITDYVGTRSIVASLGTRLTAAFGNTLTGRLYGAYQDRVIAKADELFTIEDEPKKWKKILKKWGATTFAFGTGQSWLYGLFMVGGNAIAGKDSDFATIAGGVALLTGIAPIAGTYFDKGYQNVRKWAGLPPLPEYRMKKANPSLPQSEPISQPSSQCQSHGTPE